jgi:ubiquitin C-terminal hydrolase
VRIDHAHFVYCCEDDKKVLERQQQIDYIKRSELDQVISDYNTKAMDHYCDEVIREMHSKSPIQDESECIIYQRNDEKFNLLEKLEACLAAFRPLPQVDESGFSLLKGLIQYTSNQKQSLKASQNRPSYQAYNTKGIINSELNCYMSSVVQCLNNIPILVKYLFENHSLQLDILKELRNLILQLRDATTDLPRVTGLKSAIAAKYPEFQLARSQDAMQLISKLVSEIRDADTHFVENAFVSDIISEFECKNCLKSFALPEKLPILTLKITERTSSIKECLNSYLHQELHQQRDLCSSCPVSSFRVLKTIKSAPDILICHIYRHARVGYKIQYEVKPDETVFYAGFQYSLISIICHRGNLYQGHFWALILAYDTWKICDDSFVGEASSRDLLFSEVYMVFYQRIA